MTSDIITPDIILETGCFCGDEFIEVTNGLWKCNRCGLKIVSR